MGLVHMRGKTPQKEPAYFNPWNKQTHLKPTNGLLTWLFLQSEQKSSDRPTGKALDAVERAIMLACLKILENIAQFEKLNKYNVE